MDTHIYVYLSPPNNANQKQDDPLHITGEQQ